MHNGSYGGRGKGVLQDLGVSCASVYFWYPVYRLTF